MLIGNVFEHLKPPKDFVLLLQYISQNKIKFRAFYFDLPRSQVVIETAGIGGMPLPCPYHTVIGVKADIRVK